MYRAFRVDKSIVQALETTLLALLRQDWSAIPALRMIFAGAGELRERADRVCAALALKAAVISTESPIGGGSTPDQVLPAWVVAIEVS